MTKEHNAITLAKKIDEIKQNGVPGTSNAKRVAYLMDNHPYLSVANISDILNIGKQSVYTAQWQVRKDRKEDGQITDNLNAKKPVKEKERPTQNNQQQDIWDQSGVWDGENYVFLGTEPPYVPDEQYTQQPVYTQPIAPQPVYVQPITPPQTLTQHQGAIFEIGTSGADGIAVKSLMSVVYGKVSDNRKYRVHIKIEEE